MPPRSTLPTWIQSLPADAELRIRAGTHKDNLDHVGIAERDADAVLDAVEAAGFGPVFRVHVYDAKGKHLTSRLFLPEGAEEKKAAEIPDGPWAMASRVAEQQARTIDRLTHALVEMAQANGAPLVALASLYEREAERRGEAEAAVMDAASYIKDLEVEGSRASDALERSAGADPSADPIRAQVGKVMEGLAKMMGIEPDAPAPPAAAEEPAPE